MSKKSYLGFGKLAIILLVAAVLVIFFAYFSFQKSSKDSSLIPSATKSVNHYIVSVENPDTVIYLSNLKGEVVKKYTMPDNFIKNHAGNKKVIDDKLYFLVGDKKLVSIAQLDLKIGKIKTLSFTQTKNQHVGNALTGIEDWDVSHQQGKIAWISSNGEIKVSNLDGSNLKESSTSKKHLALGARVDFTNEKGILYYYNNDDKIVRWNLNKGEEKVSLTKSETEVDYLSYSFSENGRYLFYFVFGKALHIKDLKTNIEKKIEHKKAASASYITYSSSKNQVLYSLNDFPFTEQSVSVNVYAASIDGLSNKILSKNVWLGGVISDDQLVLINKDLQPEFLDVKTGSKKKISNHYFEGVAKMDL